MISRSAQFLGLQTCILLCALQNWKIAPLGRGGFAGHPQTPRSTIGTTVRNGQRDFVAVPSVAVWILLEHEP